MARDRLSGKLAVILHADVAGSTELVQQDKELAHQRIQEAFGRFGDTIGKYRGHVLELRGDALLAEFEHASDAVSAALSFQINNAGYNSKTNDDLRPTIRVGIAMGEVVIADDTVTGAGVVQAQRVEQLAAPGDVCITAAIQEDLPKRMPVDLENLGEKSLKGFEYPVRVFRVELRSGETISPSIPQGNSKESLRLWKQMGAIAVMLVAIATITFYWLKSPTSIDEPVRFEGGTFSLPDKPSIAVLPFTNMSSDNEQEYFVDGMTEDLITDLSKISGLFVISRNSVFTYKGKSVKVRQVAKELGVRYVLEGSVRKAGNQLRINAQLIDANTGGHIWADRYDGAYEDVFLLQDKVTSKIVTTLAVKLAEGEQDQITQIETENTQAYDTFLKGWEQYQRQRPESLLTAIELFEEATRLDPDYSRAYAALSATYWQIYKRYWYPKFGLPNPHEARYIAEQYLAQAMKNPSPLSYQVSASIQAQQGLHEEAISNGERSIALDPNDADSYAALAGALNLAGQPREALSMIERAIRLNPHYPASYLYEIGLARFGINDFKRAADSLEKAIAINPDDRWSSRLLIATFGHLGRKHDAIQMIDNDEASIFGMDPLSVRSITFWYPFKKRSDTRRLAEGLRKAGVPD
ncbi:MAG: adenylate/guanylate cyclase domain-containing protein [Gammaproteobacteria bacterium]|nr:adenylate/guanylate cyclase domain-containing protein [Gammaproteobacteria bacterium]